MNRYVKRMYAAVLVAMLLGLGVACESRPPEPAPFSISTATPPPLGSASATLKATPEPTVEYVISSLPLCPGIEKLASPLRFSWPNMDEALAKLEDYNWGYFRCPLTQPELFAFTRQNMPKPPYLWREVNHADADGGTVILFYHSTWATFIYVWMLPGPDKSSSYLVIARGNPGVPQTWECRLANPNHTKGEV